MRADEHAIADGNAAVKRCKVLDLAVVADDDVNINVNVLADVAIPADSRAFTNMNPMPYRCSVANESGRGHVCGRVDPS